MPGFSPGLCGCEVGSALAGVAARPGLLEELPTCPGGHSLPRRSPEQGAGVGAPRELGRPHC